MPDDDSSAVLLQARGLAQNFDSLEVLRSIDLDVATGESVAIVGPSGCGKSSLLNILGGLMMPSAGSVSIEGVRLSEMTPDELAAFRNSQIGYVFQAHHLLPQCTALENVLIPTLVRGVASRQGAEARAVALLDSVGLGDRLSHRPSKLSGGECQRVAVVRALINGPRLLLADEPTGSLDGEAADRLGELLVDLNHREEVTLITVTHSDRLAARMQRTLKLTGGALTQHTVGG
ncbi:MAG: ABC transporter ATP-binding protein [Planctomycetota bacterium]|nr:ABC transporter ATP-binding protein [Planctomycetota bacterium]